MVNNWARRFGIDVFEKYVVSFNGQVTALTCLQVMDYNIFSILEEFRIRVFYFSGPTSIIIQYWHFLRLLNKFI